MAETLMHAENLLQKFILQNFTLIFNMGVLYFYYR